MYHFIVNIHGASGKAFLKWKKVAAVLEEKGVEYRKHVPQGPGNAAQIAGKILSEPGEKRIVILGGDGTVNEVLNGISEEDFGRVSLGLIPTGSGNDFARGLGIPRHDGRKALEVILNAGDGKKIDLGVVESDDEGALFRRRVFAISSGFGLDAIVGTSINTSKIKKALNWIHMGKLSYAILTVKTLFSMTTQKVRIVYDGESEQVVEKLIFLAAMNFPAEGGGVPMTPDAHGDDGALSSCLVGGVPKILSFFMFPFLCVGRHSKFKSFTLKDFTTLEFESDSASVVHTDGELFGSVKSARYSVLKGAISVLV